MNFRSAEGTVIDWLDTGISKHFSNFLFVDQRYGSDPVMRRIFSLARRLKYESLLIEQISEGGCPLLLEENLAIKLRRPDHQGSIVHRLSFFRTPTGQKPSPGDLCGYAIYKSDQFSGPPPIIDHVYECVMAPVRGTNENNFIHCIRPYQIHTDLGDYQVAGVLYAQQNDLTFVCAHVGLRTALSVLLPEGDITYARLNSLAGVDHQTNVVGGGKGLSPTQIETVFQSLNLSVQKFVHEPQQQLVLPVEFQRYLYGIIESSCPAMMGFELDSASGTGGGIARHIIPVFGHTFNEDTWLPDAQIAYFGERLGYYPSENWLSTFVVHDDNFGPYYCLPRSFLKLEKLRLIYGAFTEYTPLSAVEAEAVGFDYLNAIVASFPARGENWYDRFAVFSRFQRLILRTFLVKKNDYLSHLGHLSDWDGAKLEADCLNNLGNRLPERFWMVEASAPELFASSRRKFGEVLLSANLALPRPLDISLLIAARLPGICLITQGVSIVTQATALRGHSELFSMPAQTAVVV
jgi:hypothetical protein